MSILDDLRIRSAAHLVPFQATIELTYRCNERCGHCYLATYDDHADGRPPLSVDEWKGVFGQLAQAGTLVLVFIGGEAMMHPGFWELAEDGARRGFALSLITNGLLLDEKSADRMKALGFYQVSVSLYSARPHVHDQMTRRKGSFLKSSRAVELLRARGIDVVVNCLLTASNIDHCFELEDWAQERGVRAQFDPLVTARSDGELGPTALRPTEAQLKNYYQALKQRGKKIGPSSSGEASDPVCNQGRGKCAVNAYGDLLTCLEVRDPIGNLRERPFAELWTSPKAQGLRHWTNVELQFDSSSGDGAYCDHCPGMAMSETGDPMAPVPYLMEIARIKREIFER